MQSVSYVQYYRYVGLEGLEIMSSKNAIRLTDLHAGRTALFVCLTFSLDGRFE
jgi:hypothetical protein